jgi:ribosome maturation factor RimP
LRNVFEQDEREEANYFLEVSSPGLERKLNQKKHYKSAINEQVKVVFQEESSTESVEGTLKEVLPDYIIVAGKVDKKINFRSIKKASTIFFSKKEI